MSIEYVNHIVSAALADEYMEKFWHAPGTLTPFITESFQWHAARGLITQGYRDYELSFGETFSTGQVTRQKAGRVSGTLQRGYWYIQITTPVEEKILARRRAWRRYIPYQWYKRIPWRIMD